MGKPSNATIVVNTIRPADENDSYPIAFSEEVRGAFFTVETIALRNAVFAERLKKSQWCAVADDGTGNRAVYVLNSNFDATTYNGLDDAGKNACWSKNPISNNKLRKIYYKHTGTAVETVNLEIPDGGKADPDMEYFGHTGNLFLITKGDDVDVADVQLEYIESDPTSYFMIKNLPCQIEADDFIQVFYFLLND